MKVAQVMKHAVWTCQAADTLDRAAQIMWDNDCGCVPVVEGDRHVIGMITDRDICMAAYTQGAPLRSLQVRDAMSKSVCACNGGDEVAEAEKIMRTHQVHRLPVLDAFGHLIGILSLNDLAQEAARGTAAKKRDLSLAGIGATLNGICRPRPSRSVALPA